jgi:hypothetical protein
MADLLSSAGSGVCPHDAITLARITHRNADFVTPARTIAGNTHTDLSDAELKIRKAIQLFGWTSSPPEDR